LHPAQLQARLAQRLCRAFGKHFNSATPPCFSEELYAILFTESMHLLRELRGVAATPGWTTPIDVCSQNGLRDRAEEASVGEGAHTSCKSLCLARAAQHCGVYGVAAPRDPLPVASLPLYSEQLRMASANALRVSPRKLPMGVSPSIPQNKSGTLGPGFPTRSFTAGRRQPSPTPSTFLTLGG
jgi:hypothetical protein